MSSITPPQDLRSTLSAVLVGLLPPSALLRFPMEDVIARSHAEGVATMLASRAGALSDGADAAWPAGIAVATGLAQSKHRGQAANELLHRAELRRVLGLLDAAGIRVLVLKGHALAHWLYPAPYLRECSDIDLLFVDRAHAERAVQVLAPAGYRALYRPGRFAHELACQRAGGPVELDLHWALADAPALAGMPAFEALHAEAIALPGLAPSALGLSPVHALLHACVHRALNLTAGLGDRLKWLYDIHLLATGFSQIEWARFVALCRELRVSGITLASLQATHALFATRLPDSIVEKLAQARAGDVLDADRLTDWAYLQRRNLASLPGYSDRVAWLWSRLFPSADYLRALYDSQQGWLGLMGLRVGRLASRLKPDRGRAAD